MRIDAVHCVCGCEMQWKGTVVTCPECGTSDDLAHFTIEEDYELMASRESHARNLFALPVEQVKTWDELSDDQRQQARTLGSGQRGYDGYLYGIRKDGNLTGQREPVPDGGSILKR